MQNRSNWLIAIITLTIIIFIIILGCRFKNDLFGDANGNIDKNVVWTAASSFLNVVVIGVAIYTIHVESSNRKRQNEYEKIKEKENRDQENFEKECKKIFNTLLAQQLFEKIISVDYKNYREVFDEIYAFRSTLNFVEINLNWYYSEEWRKLETPCRKCLNEVINSYRTNSFAFLDRICNEIKKFYHADIFYNLENLEKAHKIMNGKLEKDKEESLGKYRNEYKDYDNMIKVIKEKIGNIVIEYSQTRNMYIIKLQEAFSNTIIERENIVRKKLSIIDKKV